MKFVTFDLESFFTNTLDSRGIPYKFKQRGGPGCNTEEYVRHPWFECHGAAIKWSPNEPAQWYEERRLRQILKDEDWSDIFLISHHAHFDHLVLSHHYDVHPRMSGCTLSMARLLLGNHVSVSLDSIRKQFNLPLKTTPYELFKGLRWREMSPDVQRQVAEGACDEVESIWTLFNILGKDVPPAEFDTIDSVIKMFSEPAIRGDIDELAKIWTGEAIAKQKRMQQLKVTEADLQSSERFAALLRHEGIEPEIKPGKTKADGTPRENYCFAKTDPFMRMLQEYDADEDDEGFSRIRTLAEARLGAKSTLMQTRAETLGFMASRGSLTVYLNYAGAGTLRPSGGDGSNFLNMKRKAPIRKALKSPDGYLLGPADSSQIECRVLHYLAGGPDEPVVQKFRNNEDPYVDLASQFYGEQIYKPKDNDPRKDEMEAKRGMGKQGRLMCGYGAAGKQFKITAKNGLYGPSVDIPLEDANNFVKLYRETTPSVCAPHSGYWAQANKMLARLAGGKPLQWGPLLVKDHRIFIQGRPMIYDTLEFHYPEPDEECRDFERGGYWRVKTRQGWKKMWGSKLVQNICEGVSRVIVSEAMTRLKAMGYRSLNWPYDELLLLIPNDGKPEWHKERCLAEMRREVSWLPGLPLDAEMNIADFYSK